MSGAIGLSRSSSRDDRRVGEARTERVDPDPVLGEPRRGCAHPADDRVLRRGVRGVEGHRREAGERGSRDDRAPAGHEPQRQLARTEDDSVEVRADDPPVLALRQLRRVRVADPDPGVEERGIEHAGDAMPRVRIADVELGQIEGKRVVEQRADRRADPAAAPGHERLHGTSTTFPTLRRDSTSSWASSTSASGNSAPTTRADRPGSQSSSNSRVAAATTSGAWRRSRPRYTPCTPTLRPTMLRRLQLGPHAARVADRDELAERTEPPDGGFEQLAADGIDDDVDPQVVRDLVVDVRLLGAELAAEIELLRRADRGDDARAERARDLDRRGADAAGRRVHEHRRAVLAAHLPRQRDVRGEEREEERRALGERRARRAAARARARSTAASSAYAPPRDERHHARPVLELARELDAEHRRELRHLRVAAAPDQDVEEVDPGRAHAHERLAVLRDRVVDVAQLERRVDRREDGGFQVVRAGSVGELLAQLDLAELADARLRDLVDELDPLGQPPLGELRREELAQLVGRRRARPP